MVRVIEWCPRCGDTPVVCDDAGASVLRCKCGVVAEGSGKDGVEVAIREWNENVRAGLVTKEEDVADNEDKVEEIRGLEAKVEYHRDLGAKLRERATKYEDRAQELAAENKELRERLKKEAVHADEMHYVLSAITRITGTGAKVEVEGFDSKSVAIMWGDPILGKIGFANGDCLATALRRAIADTHLKLSRPAKEDDLLDAVTEMLAAEMAIFPEEGEK